MKELKTYQCGICESVYSDEASCKTCEASHRHPIMIEKIVFGSYQSSPVPYPERIQFRMGDGALVQYVCERIVEQPTTENEVNEQ